MASLYIYGNNTTSTANVWSSWTTNSTSISNTDYIWQTWTDNVSISSPTSSSTTGIIWGLWAGSHTQTSQTWDRPTAEQLRVEHERNKRLEAERLTLQRERDEARARARELLMMVLSQEQRAEYEEKKQFRLYTQSGKCYLVKRGRSGNVTLIENDKEVERYCIHPPDMVPDEDTLVAQKLLLETNEAEFLKIANKTRLVA